MASQTLVGVFVLFRHGDRAGFYQSPTSYTPSNTEITPLGEAQEYQLGQLFRSRYITPGSATAIDGINSTLFDGSQVNIRADAGGEGTVIYDSTVAWTQGAWPATPASNTTLANGTTIVSPLQGYQYVGVDSIDPEDDYTLESWVECPAFAAHTKNWYSSQLFKDKAAQSQPALADFAQVVGTRNVTFENMYNVFDFLNVQRIHNVAFLQSVSENTLEQARDLANWHEYTGFSDQKPDSIGNIAGRAILPVIFSGLNDIANVSSPTKIYATGISYKPFISLFNLTGIAAQQPALAGIVNYAASLAFEVRRDSVAGRYSVTTLFKNGTDDPDYAEVKMANGSSSVWLDDLETSLNPYTITSLGQWCNECQNTDSRGCGTISALNETESYQGPDSTIGRQHVSPLASGFIGAVVALLLATAVLAAMYALGMLAIGKRGMRQRSGKHRPESYALPAYDTKTGPVTSGEQ